MKTTRRLFTIAVTLGLVLTVVGTAAGRPSCEEKPDAPWCSPALHTYEVTMSAAGSSGLATTCTASGSITMSGSPNSSLETLNGFLEIRMPIGWWRHFEASSAATGESWGLGGTTLEGCHGLSASADTGDSFGGKMWLSFGQGTLDMEWRFDYYWQFRYETKGKKLRKVQEGLELLALEGNDLRWNPTETDGTLSGTVSGPVSLLLFTKDAVGGISENWTLLETTPMSFQLTITPIG